MQARAPPRVKQCVGFPLGGKALRSGRRRRRYRGYVTLLRPPKGCRRTLREHPRRFAFRASYTHPVNGSNLTGGTAAVPNPVRRWVWAPILAVILAVTMVGAGPVSGQDPPRGQVVVVGIPGLLWTDLDPADTPHLWKLLGDSGAASMAVRAATTKTCPDDAWVSIGAGNRGKSNYPQGTICPLGSLIGPPLRHSDNTWWMSGQTQLDDANSSLNYRTTPGLVADLVDCAAAIGPGAAVAAAHPDGRVDRYATDLPSSAKKLAAFTRDCPAVFIDPQTPVYGQPGSPPRLAAMADTDKAIGAITALLDSDTALLVAGISDATIPANLHPAMLRAPGHANTWLESAATRRTGYVQLADIGPTVVTLTGNSVIESQMAGQPLKPADSRVGNTAGTVATGINANLAGRQIPPLSDGFYATLTVLGLIVVAAAVIWCRRLSLVRGERLSAVLVTVALMVASLPVASLLVNAVPWWRGANPAANLWGLMIGISVALGAVAAWGPWRRHPLGPPAVVATVTAVVIGFDCVTGTHLQFNSLSGYSAITGARFTGMGNYAFGVFAGSAIIAALYLTVRLCGWHKIAALATIATTLVLIDGFPSWGNDVGGVIALTPAFILAGLHAAGRRLSIKKIAVSVVTGVVAIAVLMTVDYLRPADRQTHLGRFVGELLHGSAGATVMRKAWAALQTVTAGPLTLLVVAACVAVPLLWHNRLVHSVVARHPVVLSAGIGVAATSILGFAFNDSGIAVPAFTLAVAAPLFLATVVAHRTEQPDLAATPAADQKNSSSKRYSAIRSLSAGSSP